ncbi:hypothetical protein BD289DRAFT_422524 [Coniella lustricola]|uniref:JmjC domain-containing protein n=1 Tax=Coniella lustricola TaxID=2025994 RepID=A0A2T3AK93_9PEZI|nr:hypothetical protein BD289DRAFT_422524 [Coniella lustricola]
MKIQHHQYQDSASTQPTVRLLIGLVLLHHSQRTIQHVFGSARRKYCMQSSVSLSCCRQRVLAGVCGYPRSHLSIRAKANLALPQTVMVMVMAGPVEALRDWCLAAAEDISQECRGILADNSTLNMDAAVSKSSSLPSSLVGCGEPLVHLLCRQASRVIALYEEKEKEKETEKESPAQPPSASSLPLSSHSGLLSRIGKHQQHDASIVQLPWSDCDETYHRRDEACQKQKQSRAQIAHREGQAQDQGQGRLRVRADDLVLARLDDIMSIAYARFYAFLYKDLPVCWRQLYTDAAILKFSHLVLVDCQAYQGCLAVKQSTTSAGRLGASSVNHAAHRPPPAADETLDEMVKTLDLALILAGASGLSRGRAWIDKAFELLESVFSMEYDACASKTDVSHRCNDAHHEYDVCEGRASMVPPAPKRKKLHHHFPRVDGDDNDADDNDNKDASRWAAEPSFSSHEPFTPPVHHPIRRCHATSTMDMVAFQRYLNLAPRTVGPQPLVLTGLVDHWPARRERPWEKPSYLLSQALGGRRLVPVEIGRSYVDEGWGQTIVKFGDFLEQYIGLPVKDHGNGKASTSPSFEEPIATAKAVTATQSQPQPQKPDKDDTSQPIKAIAYLAQHQLLLQLPQLRGDILIPDHCYTAPPGHPHTPSSQIQSKAHAHDHFNVDYNDNNDNYDDDNDAEPLLNVWFGPPGTITPLHTDPYHNLLVQVVGRKYVRLYSPLETTRMRPRGKEDGVEMGNTSLWDVGVMEGWDDDVDTDEKVDVIEGRAEKMKHEKKRKDEEKRKAFKEVPYVDCILNPGDTLYIPIGWWHYVRGLSISFSVSIWWK